MCGIAGWIDWSKDLSQEKRTLLQMTDAISHRGKTQKDFGAPNTLYWGIDVSL